MMKNDKPIRVVGLQYDPEDGLPIVTVKGSGPLADTLLRATLNVTGPRVVRDPELLEQLYRLPIDTAIDPSLFQVVATVLTHVFAVNEKMKGSNHA
jgi:flagellar biosynthesis protein